MYVNYNYASRKSLAKSKQVKKNIFIYSIYNYLLSAQRRSIIK